MNTLGHFSHMSSLLKHAPAAERELPFYFGTLKPSHPEPRGVAEIRASGDLQPPSWRFFLMQQAHFLFSHLCTDAAVCVCVRAPHLHTPPIYLPPSLLKAFEEKMKLLSPFTLTPF